MKSKEQETAVDLFAKRSYDLFEMYSEGKFARFELNAKMTELWGDIKEMEKQRMIEFAKQCLDKALDLDVRTAYSMLDHFYNETYGGNK
jgi:hypothetical protein